MAETAGRATCGFTCFPSMSSSSAILGFLLCSVVFLVSVASAAEADALSVALPFSDPACFIEEYAGLVGSMYDTEEFDRQKAKAIIVSLLKPAQMQYEVAAMLYASMEELTPILALEDISPSVYEAFMQRVTQVCNGGTVARRLEGVGSDEPEGSEITEETHRMLQPQEEESSQEESSVVEEEDKTKALLGVLIRRLQQAQRSELAANTNERSEEEQTDGEPSTSNTNSRLRRLAASSPSMSSSASSSTAPTVESLQAAVASATGGLALTASNSLSQLFGMITPGDVETLRSSIILPVRQADSNSLIQLSDSVTSRLHDRPSLDILSFGSREGQRVANIVRQGPLPIRDCSFLDTSDRECFIIEYAGFVGATWDTEDFDRLKAEYIINTFLEDQVLLRTVSNLMCLTANLVLPQISGDDTMTRAAIDSFFLNVPATCQAQI